MSTTVMSAHMEQNATTTTATRAVLTKEEFVRVIETNLQEIRFTMDELRDKSRANLLPEKDLENAFNNLYDAKDLLDFYAKQLVVSEENDTFLKSEWTWVKDYMNDLVEFDVGTNAEIRRVTNYTLKSRNGSLVGQGDEIEVKHIPANRGHRGTIYHNWMEIDRTFWIKDHNEELLDYERGETHRPMDYEDGYGRCGY